MADARSQTTILRKGLHLLKLVSATETLAEAYRLIVESALDCTRASHVHLYTPDDSSKPEVSLPTTRPSSPEEMRECLGAVNAALERHRQRYPSTAATTEPQSIPDTDEEIPLCVVAKVLSDHERLFAIVVMVKEGLPAFNVDQRWDFTALCLNAQSGLARRCPRRIAPSASQAGGSKAKKKGPAGPVAGIFGSSPQIVVVCDQMHAYGPEDSPVLILGETGTGKELVANGIHLLSSRRDKVFLAVNAAALSATVVESELFGHVKGAFTGAHTDIKGVFRAAEGGTVFVDEVGEMPLEVQVKLLRVLENYTVKPVGSEREVPVDFRLIAGTNRDLKQLVDEGKFRRDLYHRLNVLDIVLPPLRERTGDARLLALHFLEEEARGRANGPFRFSDAALDAIERAPWEGNVRELKNAVTRAVVHAKNGVIDPSHLKLTLEDADPSLSLKDNTLRRSILTALRHHDGNRSRAAKELGMDRGTVVNHLKRFGLNDRV